MRETYLGVGLYASFDGYMFILRAPRQGGDHFVGLEPPVLQAFNEYVAAIKNAANLGANLGADVTPEKLTD